MVTTGTASLPPGAPSWDGQRPGRPFQLLLVAVAVLALVPAVLATVLRLVPPADDATALIAAFIPYGLLGYLIALVCLVLALVRARRRAGLAALTSAVALAVSLQLSWLVPFFVADDRPATTPGFRLMSLNMYKGLADPATVARQAEQADVVILIEATPFVLKDLESDGWRQRFPYAVGDLRTDISDTAVYSRYPLSNGRLLGGTSFQQWQVQIDVPDLGPVQLIAAHPCNPFCRGGRWSSEHALLNRAAAAAIDRPLVVAGDLNAVDDHGPMQALHRLGLTSVTDLTGAGWLPTWPANRRFPPLLPIDHILVSSRLTATSVDTFAVPGTDHLGLVTTIAGA